MIICLYVGVGGGGTLMQKGNIQPTCKKKKNPSLFMNPFCALFVISGFLSPVLCFSVELNIIKTVNHISGLSGGFDLFV